MSLLQNSIAASMIVAAFSMPAHAHFPWIVLTPQERPTQAAVYFGESATRGDPDLLDRIAHADVRLLSGWRSEPRELELATTDDALVAELKDAAPASSAVLQLEYGVISRGGAPFLLKYYGKAHSSVLPGAWRTVGDADLLPLEITAQLEHTQLNLHVAWQGEAAPGVELTIGGPGFDENVTGTTDDAGNLRCELADSGLYSIRARHVEESAGEHDGQAYHQIRHYSTLTLHYARPMATTAENSWPALPRGVTSFGAAVAGDWLYVYGGHLGGAHAYSADAQSGEFSRLNLAQPTEWEPLPGGPKRTGLAMVSHGGKLYRIGGFSALNSEGEDDNLVSQADVARFDPQSMQWETLPALPAGRSSLDAAVIGEAIYVVGGWNLQGGRRCRVARHSLEARTLGRPARVARDRRTRLPAARAVARRLARPVVRNRRDGVGRRTDDAGGRLRSTAGRLERRATASWRRDGWLRPIGVRHTGGALRDDDVRRDPGACGRKSLGVRRAVGPTPVLPPHAAVAKRAGGCRRRRYVGRQTPEAGADSRPVAER